MRGQLTDTREDLEPVRRRSRAVIGLALAVVMVAAALGTWLALRPDAPTLVGSHTVVDFDADEQPVANSAGMAALSLPRPSEKAEILTFHARPVVHFKTNTAGATAKVEICVSTRQQSVVAVGPASDLSSVCSSVRDVADGTRLRWFTGTESSAGLREYLIIVVTPTRPGVATVDRITYDYEDGDGHSGTDSGNPEYTVRAS